MERGIDTALVVAKMGFRRDSAGQGHEMRVIERRRDAVSLGKKGRRCS